MAGRIAVVGEESEIALYRGTDAIVYAVENRTRSSQRGARCPTTWTSSS
jgi:hypothetical protein